jgi:hypothetical protein
MWVPQGRTRDGFELQIGTNHLGPFALTNLLLPHITSRVVTVSSQLHCRGRLDLDDLNWQRRPYRSLQAYCDSGYETFRPASLSPCIKAAGERRTLSVGLHNGHPGR